MWSRRVVAAVGVGKDPAAEPVAGRFTPDVAAVADRARFVPGAIRAGRQVKGLVQVGGALHVLKLVGVAGAGLDKAADKDIRGTALALLALLVDDGAQGLGVAHLARRLHQKARATRDLCAVLQELGVVGNPLCRAVLGIVVVITR